MYIRLIIPLSLITIGASILILSYIYTALVLTFIGLGLTFWGLIIYYITSSYHVSGEILDAINTSFTKSIADIISKLGYGKNMIFFYPKHLKDINQGYILITNDKIDIKHELIQNYISDDNLFVNSNGLLIKAPSQNMIELFENKLGTNLTMFDLNTLGDNLAKVFVEDLRLADELHMSVDGNIINVKIIGKEIAKICSKTNDINASLCPICSSIALAISKSSGKMITMDKSIAKANSIENVYSIIGA